MSCAPSRLRGLQAKGGEVPPAKGTPHELKKRKQSHNSEPTRPDHLVTIYKLIYKPKNRAVYTGRTKNHLEDRFKQHAARTSGCRLVRNAIRRYGMGKFAIEPIVRCHADDADANESYYIMANKTLHPDGYNLRHGSKAGDESERESQLVPSASRSGVCENVQNELQAHSDAMADLVSLCDEAEESADDEDADAMSLALLDEVHTNIVTPPQRQISQYAPLPPTIRKLIHCHHDLRVAYGPTTPFVPIDGLLIRIHSSTLTSSESW